MEELSELREGQVIIVEGKRDVISLKRLGITKVVSINTYGGLEEVAEGLHRMGVRRVVILTDFDRKGEELRRKLLPHLLNWGITEIPRLRLEFRNALGVVEVEEAYIRFLEIEGGEKYGKDIRRLRKVPHSRSVRGKGIRGQARRYRGHLRSDGGTPGW